MKEKKKVLLLGGLMLLLAVLTAGAVWAYFGFMKKEVVVDETIPHKLYWNADREQYIPKLGGDTTRKPEDDGLWTVRFVVEGEQVEYRVKDRQTMIAIDRLEILGLEVDEEGIITQVIDIRDMGYREIANYFYVQAAEEDTVIANASLTGSFADLSFKLSKETRIWNVTGTADPLGKEDALQLMDCIRAFNNENGTISDIFITERQDIFRGVSPERYCEHCGQVVRWRMWMGGTTLPYSSGHFRLIKDVELKEQYSMNKDCDTIFDLNGKTITRAGAGRVISVHNAGDTLTIVDGSEEQTGAIKGHGECTATGGVLWVRYGTFNLYKGKIDASEVVDAGAHGAALAINADATFNMYGGTIIGGLAQAKMNKNEETGKETLGGGTGGAIYCVGTINMYDGTIRDGRAATCLNKEGKMQTIAGGNIALANAGVMNLYNGKITGGTLMDPIGHGGNISVRNGKAVLNIKGGIIENGVSMLQGGNIASWGTINMSGGTIRGGKNMTGNSLKNAVYNETSNTHNIFLVSATFNMSGGTVKGYVAGTKGTKDKAGEYIDNNVVLSGTARICGGVRNLTMGTTLIRFGKLTGNAKVGINGTGFISTETIEANAKYVFSDYEGVNVLFYKNRLFIGKVSCMCDGYLSDVDGAASHDGKHASWCNGTMVEWKPWDATKTALPAAAGAYYLIGDIELKSQAAIGGAVTLDLNGHTVTKKTADDPTKATNRVIQVVKDNATYTITDTSRKQTGAIRFEENFGHTVNGEFFFFEKPGTANIYRGLFDMRNITGKTAYCPINVAQGHLKIYGGTFLADSKTGTGSNCIAMRAGELAIYGGTIYGEVVLQDATGSLIISGSPKVGLQPENGSAKYGIRTTATSLTTVTCENVTKNAEVIFKSGDNIMVNLANSAVSAFEFSGDKDGHYGLVKKSDKTFAFATTVCVCGANISNDSGHSCAWVKAQKKGIEAVYALNWKPWDATKTALPATAGAYYLTEDMKPNSVAAIPSGYNIYLDLNGKTVTRMSSGRVLQFEKKNATYTIADSKQGGTICFDDKYVHGSNGALFQFTADATLNIYGGTFDMRNLTGSSTAPPINVTQGQMNIYGGTIMAARTTGTGTNCIVVKNTASLNIKDGTIYGEVIADNAPASLTISGSPQVGLQPEGGSAKYGIKASKATTITCKNVAAAAKIVLQSATNITIELINSEVSAFELLDNNDGHYGLVKKSDGTVALGTTICVCGANISDDSGHNCAWVKAQEKGIEAAYALNWQPWDATKTALPNTTGAYYLTEDLELRGAKTSVSQTVYLDLNGHTVTKYMVDRTALSAENRVLQIANASAEYTITDSKQGGNICFEEGYHDLNNGELFYVTAGTLNIYGGRFDMSNITGSKGEFGPIYASASGRMNIYGGTFIAANKTNGVNCIRLYNTGSLSIYGGTIYGQVVLQKPVASLTIGGSPKVGLQPKNGDTRCGIEAWEEDTKVVCDKVSEDAEIVLYSGANINLSGTGSPDGFKFATNNGLEVVVGEDGKLKLQTKAKARQSLKKAKS